MSGVPILADAFGWIGNFGFLLSSYYLARRKKPVPAMYWAIFGNALYGAYAIVVQTPSLMVLSIMLVAMNIYGIQQWKKGSNIT